MDQGKDIKSPLLQRNDVIEKRMEMLAMLMDRINEEGAVNQQNKKGNDKKNKKKGGNKRRLMGLVVGIFFHRVE